MHHFIVCEEEERRDELKRKMEGKREMTFILALPVHACGADKASGFDCRLQTKG